MPEAHSAYSASIARVPRSIFAHAHIDGNAVFPPSCSLATSEMLLQLPDNWHGTEALIIKVLAGEAWVNEPFNITFNAGADGEAPNVHTQTVANHLISCANGIYEYADMTVAFAVFIALLNSNDLIWATIADVNGISGNIMGLEIRET